MDRRIRGTRPTGSNEFTIPPKRDFAERIALELRLAHVHLVEGMGGGGSVKMIEMKAAPAPPQMAGWESVVQHPGVAPSVALALGSVAGIGAARR